MGLALIDSADQPLWFIYIFPSLWLLCFSLFYLYRQLQALTFVAFLIFGIALIALGYFDVFILFVILTWALKKSRSHCLWCYAHSIYLCALATLLQFTIKFFS